MPGSTFVALPKAGTLDDKLRPCQEGWEECRDRLRWEVIAESGGALEPWEAGAACYHFKTMCEERVRAEGTRGVFEMGKAEERMRAIFESSAARGSPLEPLENIFDSLPRIRLPVTGTGGYKSNPKEGRGFAHCVW